MYKVFWISFVILVSIICFLIAYKPSYSQQKGSAELEKLRHTMVRDQIEQRGVKDRRVLEAMRTVPRHLFVSDISRSEAYEDRPLPIAEGQTISQPYIVGLMTELLGLQGHERVLEVGTGSGYQAAVLAKLCRQVYTIEIIPELAQAAKELLLQLGITNVAVRCADGYAGWPEEAPFDAVIVTCAPAQVPPALIQQLADGGRLVIPVGEFDQELKLIVKSGSTIQEKTVIPVRFVPMIKKTSDAAEKTRCFTFSKNIIQ